MNNRDQLIIAGKKFKSRLFLGTGKFQSSGIMIQAIEAAESEIVTTAVRRIDLKNPQDSFIKNIDPRKYLFLPNTSGARNAEEAVRVAKIARASGVSNWIKLEVTPDPNYLLPCPVETLAAAKELVKLNFVVLPYINADPVLAKHLEETGCATVMPLASPIGSNRGIKTKEMINIIIEMSNIPVVVDAGLGCPSHAAEVMEAGADAVLVNTAIATAKNPVLYAEAFKLAVESGRKAFLAGIPGVHNKASASSPLTGFLQK
ncbi:MAG: thiazole synthase [bacterium]|nr:thiazole synthase [bacterium]